MSPPLKYKMVGPYSNPPSDAISIACTSSLVIHIVVQRVSRSFHVKFPRSYFKGRLDYPRCPSWLLNCYDDLIFRDPVVREMRREPDFIAGEVQQRELIVKISDVTVFIGIAVHTALLVDLILISFSIIEQVAEQLVHRLIFIICRPELYDPATSLLSGRIEGCTFGKLSMFTSD